MQMRLLGCLLLFSCRNNTAPGVDTDAPVSTDQDDDGYAAEDDCDDLDEAAYPGAEELCDGIDNDCDGDIDEGTTTTFYVDAD